MVTLIVLKSAYLNRSLERSVQGISERKKAIERTKEDELPARLDLRWSDQIRNLEDMLFVAYCEGNLEPAEKQSIVNYANFLSISQQQLSVIRDQPSGRSSAIV